MKCNKFQYWYGIKNISSNELPYAPTEHYFKNMFLPIGLIFLICFGYILENAPGAARKTERGRKETQV